MDGRARRVGKKRGRGTWGALVQTGKRKVRGGGADGCGRADSLRCEDGKPVDEAVGHVGRVRRERGGGGSHERFLWGGGRVEKGKGKGKAGGGKAKGGGGVGGGRGRASGG